MTRAAAVNVLSIATLFPTPETPQHGIFVERRLQAVSTAEPAFRFHIYSPVPWFPLRVKVFGSYGRFARIPSHAEIGQFTVHYPRYFMVPKLRIFIQWRAVYRSLKRRIGKDKRRFDLIDAQYGYPDAPAAAQIARDMGLPLVITVRGSDVTQHLRKPSSGAAMRKALNQAAAIICVGDNLREILVAEGFSSDRVITVRNGVNIDQFSGADRADARRYWAVSGCTVLSVGWLIDRKRMDWCIRAIAPLKDVTLLIAGEGPKLRGLQRLVRELDCGDRVRFVGTIPPTEMPRFMAAGDVFLLASTHEGLPNVILEAMAAGNSIVSTAAGSVHDCVPPQIGDIVDTDDFDSFAEAVRRRTVQNNDRRLVMRHARQFDWAATVDQQVRLYLSLAETDGN